MWGSEGHSAHELGRGGGCAQLCIQWVRPTADTASQLEKGHGKTSESSGIWETAFEWEVEAGPCLFSLSQARLGCDSIAASTHLHGEGIPFSQKHVMKPSSGGLERVSHRSRNSPEAGRALHPHPRTAKGFPTAPLRSGSLSPGCCDARWGTPTPGSLCPGGKVSCPSPAAAAGNPQADFPSCKTPASIVQSVFIPIS